MGYRSHPFRNLLQQIERHNPSRIGHGDLVSVYAVAVAERLGLEDLVTLRLAAMISDAPKLLVPTDVLEKAGPLTEDEKEALSHARHHFLLPFEDEERDKIQELVRNPSQLLKACIAYVSMTRKQSWRKALTHPQAMENMVDYPSSILSAIDDVSLVIQPIPIDRLQQ